MSRKFTWELFSTQFIKSIIYSEKTRKNLRPSFYTDEKMSLLPYIDSICAEPNEHFVRRYYSEIMDNFFADSTHLVTVVTKLEKHNCKGIHAASMADMLEQLRNVRRTSTVMTIIISELYRAGNKQILEDENFSIFTTPKQIDLEACIPDNISMYDYQNDAIKALNKYFIEENNRAGILSMPTGSGKTRTATRFLIENLVAEGWQVIWLTHRAMLIEQTADSVYNSAGAILKMAAPHKSTFKMVCVSGSHASVKATEKDDDVIISSVQSLVRNLPYLQAILHDKVFIIVDEAHHTLAPSYRIIINEIQKHSAMVKLLGLTATPVRMSDSDTAKLMALYDNKIIYSISMSTLITKGFLSKPQYEQIATNVDFSTSVTLDERKYIQKWGELSAETMEKMARMTERNTVIADTYINNKERYGKTLIFALNSTHCIALCEELQKRNVRCDYIYCAHSGNAEKIERFKKGELDVLVNIQVLTEGSDIPDIQTVFLTRPTGSDVLLMQMIGRGMRGVGSGGTETVNIVDFHDIWGDFVNWLNPEFAIDCSLNNDTDDDIVKKTSDRDESKKIQWGMIRDLLDGIHTSYAQSDAQPVNSALPIGWYDVLDEDGNDGKVLVFESQLSSYINMWKHKDLTLNNPDFCGETALDKWFDGFGILPNAHDIQLILNMYRLSGEFPHLHHFKERDSIDAALLAKQLKEKNVGVSDLENRISEVYQNNQGIINSVYGGSEEYRKRVIEFMYYPNGIKPLGMKIEETEPEELLLDRTPVYDLAELTDEVVKEMFGNAYGDLPPINWTNCDYSGYYGQYNYRSTGDFIRINRILNSKDVPREVVKYIIYHELLHRDYYYHNSTFRALEHRYPMWTEHERFLDFTFPKFNLEYAM